MVLHCTVHGEPFTLFLPFLAQLMVLSNRNQDWEEGWRFKPLCVCVCVAVTRLSLLRSLWSIMQWERERKRTSSLIQMTHKDTWEQKTAEDKENEDRKRGAIKGGRTEHTGSRVWQRLTETHKDAINIISIQLVHNKPNTDDSIITAWTLDSQANPHAAKL